MPITLDTLVYSNVGFNQNGQFVYSERSGGIPTAFSYLTTKVNTGTGKADSTVKWNLSIPIVATEDSACGCDGSVIRSSYVKIEVSLSSTSSAAEREHVRKSVRDLVASTQFIASIDNLVQPSA